MHQNAIRHRTIEHRTIEHRKGNALIEFTLLGIPLMFITISIVSVSIDMWEFHNLSYAVQATARYVTMHGETCTKNGNSCTINVGNVATYFKGQALALDPTQVIVKLTDSSGTTTCNPVNNCTSSATQFPASGGNSVGSDVTVKATYVLRNPIALFWPPNEDSPSVFTVGATSRQRVLF